MEKFLSYASNGISFSIGIEMHVISLPMIFIFLSYERKEASVGVTIVASSTAGTVVSFKKRNSTKSWWFLRPSNFKVGSGPVIWRLISHCYCGAMTKWLSLGVLRAWQVDQDGRRPTCWWTEVFFPISNSKETAWYSITAHWFSNKYYQCWFIIIFYF